jgi:ribonucleoside-diphosphate reductase alpha chain
MTDRREKLPATRRSVTHKAAIHAEGGRVKFFFTLGFYEDGRPAELFLHMDESGSTLDGFADAWSFGISLCLQGGIPWQKIVEKFGFAEFEPKGRTEDDWIRTARSVVDYVVRWVDHYMKERDHGDQESPNPAATDPAAD